MGSVMILVNFVTAATMTNKGKLISKEGVEGCAWMGVMKMEKKTQHLFQVGERIALLRSVKTCNANTSTLENLHLGEYMILTIWDSGVQDFIDLKAARRNFNRSYR